MLTLKALNVVHNNLSLNTILFGANSIKLHHPSLFQKTNFDCILEGSKHYASPELVDSIRKGADLTDFDYFKSDVFSLGLLILELGTLVVEESFYDDSELRKDVVQLKFNMMKTQFSPKLMNIVQFMLSSSASRPSLEQLLTIGASNLQHSVFANLMKPTPLVHTTKLSQYIREITGLEADSHKKENKGSDSPRNSGLQRSSLRLKSSENREGFKNEERAKPTNELKLSREIPGQIIPLRESLVKADTVKQPLTSNPVPIPQPQMDRVLFPIQHKARSPDLSRVETRHLSPGRNVQPERYLEKVTTISSILDPNMRNSGSSTNRLRIDVFDNENQQKIVKRFNEEMRSRSTSPLSQTNTGGSGPVPYPPATMLKPFSRVSAITEMNRPSNLRPVNLSPSPFNKSRVQPNVPSPISISPRNNRSTELPTRYGPELGTPQTGLLKGPSKLVAFPTSYAPSIQQSTTNHLGSNQKSMTPSQYNALPDFVRGFNRTIAPVSISPKGTPTKSVLPTTCMQRTYTNQSTHLMKSPPRQSAVQQQFLNPGLLSPNRALNSLPLQATTVALTATNRTAPITHQQTNHRPKEISPKDVFSSFAELEEKYNNNARIRDVCKDNWMDDSKDYRDDRRQQRTTTYQVINGVKVPINESRYSPTQERALEGQRYPVPVQQAHRITSGDHLEERLPKRREMDESVSLKKLEMMENMLLVKTKEINDKIDGMIKREVFQEELFQKSQIVTKMDGTVIKDFAEQKVRTLEDQNRVEVDILGKLFVHASSRKRTSSSEESSSPFAPKSVNGQDEESHSNLLRENSGSITISPQTAHELKMGNEDKVSWIDNCEQALSTSIRSDEDEETLLNQFRKNKRKLSKTRKAVSKKKKQSPKSKSPTYCASYLPQEEEYDRQLTPRKVFQDNNYWSRLIKEGERADSRPAQIFHMQTGENGSRRIEFDNPVPFVEVKNKLLKPLVSTPRQEKSQQERRPKDGELEKIGEELNRLRNISKKEGLKRSKAVY